MAGWLTALKMIPWDVVVNNAPAVVDGAKKLWSAVGKDRQAQEGAPAGMTAEARLEALEAEVTTLQREMASSAELIKALADQNAQLIQAVALLRRRQRILTGALIVVAIVALACVTMLTIG